MTAAPSRWTLQQLGEDAEQSVQLFRAQRLEESDAFAREYSLARGEFSLLLDKLGGLNVGSADDATLAQAYGAKLGDAIRYLAGPPISADDLQVLADVQSLAPGSLIRDPQALRKVYTVIGRLIDPFRFPWVIEGKPPTREQREAALMASSVLLAAQRIETERRNEGKQAQEAKVKDCLRGLGFEEAGTETIRTIVKGPPARHFCAECLLGERKADVIVRLHDTRLMAIECKVSNSSTNSIKRLNNDAAVKAEYWLKLFGTSQVVPAAMLAGVFKVKNLQQSQERGLALFWSHDLDKLGAFIESTR
jgi:hypothetical protein